jgi:uncharacterized alkaline shock family protein YloU
VDGHRTSKRATAGGTDEPVGRGRTSDPFTVSRGVILEMVSTAALEVPGVLRVSRGGRLAWLSGPAVKADVRDGKASIRVWIVARPGHALGPLAAQVRQVVTVTVERLLGLEIGEVTVIVAGVGSPGS